jgi:ABC-2 type transport system permease protein
VRRLFLLWRRELLASFVSPVAWIVGSVFLFVNGLVFRDALIERGGDVSSAWLFFLGGGGLQFWFFLLLLPAVLTARLFALEKSSGTLETLMTAPVSDVEVVAAKFLAALTLFTAVWAPTIVYYFVLEAWGGAPDPGPIAAGYLGVVGVGALFCALGCLASSMTSSQVVAFFATAIGSLLLLLGPVYGAVSKSAAVASVSRYLDLVDHFDELARGVVDPRRLLYYASASLLFLFLTVRSVEARKWK